MWWQILSLLTASAVAENLYATDYSGFVYSINFSPNNNTLTKTQQLQSCGQMPSWFEFDAQTRTLYCADENSFPNGSLTTFSAAPDGTLTQQAQIETIGGGVNTVLYGGSEGDSYIAIAHYQSSAISTFKLPITSASTAQQALLFTLPHPGPNPVRQNITHPHQVALDPSSKFIITPDLGADLVRIYSIEPTTGMLNQCPSYVAPPGSGPRHAAFWSIPAAGECVESEAVDGQVTASGTGSGSGNGTVMYLVSELANNVTALDVTYTSDGCLSLQATQTGWTYADTPPPGSTIAEVRVSGNILMVTNRNTSTSLQDSIASFSISPTDGSLTFLNTSPSYGSWPRTLSINANATYAAVGDQDDGAAVIMEMNGNGTLGEMVAKIVLGPGGTMGNNGLSSVVWEASEGGSEL